MNYLPYHVPNFLWSTALILLYSKQNQMLFADLKVYVLYRSCIPLTYLTMNRARVSECHTLIKYF